MTATRQPTIAESMSNPTVHDFVERTREYLLLWKDDTVDYANDFMSPEEERERRQILDEFNALLELSDTLMEATPEQGTDG